MLYVASSRATTAFRDPVYGPDGKLTGYSLPSALYFQPLSLPAERVTKRIDNETSRGRFRQVDRIAALAAQTLANYAFLLEDGAFEELLGWSRLPTTFEERDALLSRAL